MKPIPWQSLAGAVKQARTNPEARALLAEHVAGFVAEGQARAIPQRDMKADLAALLARVQRKPLPVPVSTEPVPQSHHDTDREDDAP